MSQHVAHRHSDEIASYHRKIHELRAENEQLKAALKTELQCASVHDWGYWYVDKRVYDELCAENEQLKAGMREYACTGGDQPCGCYDQFLSERTELERLRDLLAFNGIDPDATIEAAKGAASAGKRR